MSCSKSSELQIVGLYVIECDTFACYAQASLKYKTEKFNLV